MPNIHSAYMHSAHIYTQYTLNSQFQDMFFPSCSCRSSVSLTLCEFFFSLFIFLVLFAFQFALICLILHVIWRLLFFFTHLLSTSFFSLSFSRSFSFDWFFFSSSLVCVFICFVCDYEWIYHSFAPRNALDICSMLHLIIIIINIIKSTPFQSRRRCQWKKERWL